MATRAEGRGLLGQVLRHKVSQQATVDWKPHNDRGAMAWLRSRNPHVTFVIGVLTGSVLIGISAWLMGGHTIRFPSLGEPQTASATPRYAPLNLAERPLSTKSEPEPVVASADQTAHIVVDEEAVELRTGQRVRLGARIDDADLLAPETVALVSGLPEDVQLSDGIKINTQLWMFRPDLLSSIEINAARGLVGRYPLRIELRTPDGRIISSAQTILTIRAAVEQTQAMPAVTEERKEPLPSASAEEKQSTASANPAAPGRTLRPRADPARRVKARTVVTRPEQITSPKPVQKTRSVRPNTTASVPPVVVQGPQSEPQQKLVWPGDNPRAAYSQNPPFFLGASPNAAPQSRPSPAQDENWHRRVFEQR